MSRSENVPADNPFFYFYLFLFIFLFRLWYDQLIHIPDQDSRKTFFVRMVSVQFLSGFVLCFRFLVSLTTGPHVLRNVGLNLNIRIQFVSIKSYIGTSCISIGNPVTQRKPVISVCNPHSMHFRYFALVTTQLVSPPSTCAHLLLSCALPFSDAACVARRDHTGIDVADRRPDAQTPQY